MKVDLVVVLTKSMLCFGSCFTKDAYDVSCKGVLFDYLS